jgi:actin-related protein 9
MSSQTGKWREEQVLVVCPGSQTTLAQLGCNELTPPIHRFPTRMFRDVDSESESGPGGWRAYHTYKRKKKVARGAGGAAGGAGGNGVGAAAAGGNGNAGAGGGGEGANGEEWEYVEDMDSAEGAVYPIQGRFTLLLSAIAACHDCDWRCGREKVCV